MQTQGAHMDSYQEFIAGKEPRAIASGVEPGPITASLFDYQRHCAEFAIRAGRSGLFLDTGLGKTIVELEFAHQALRASNGRALLLTPLAVARQIEREATRFGYDARVIREQHEAKAGINICNYDRLEKLDLDHYGVVVCDESGILKSFTGKTTRALISGFSGHKFRMSATATPAPNDHMELGQQCEFLGIMPSNEMLARWFISDQTEMGRYRLKRHGVDSFWDWMSSWARMAETPADLGFDGSRFVLPALNIIRHKCQGQVKSVEGELFAMDVSATGIHTVKRQTCDARAELISGLVSQPGTWLIWCDTDYEADAILKAVPEAVEVRGSHRVDIKEERLADFSEGRARVMLTKPSVAGYGLNWQHCHQIVFAGRSFSYEAWYQAVRRCWRFGQTKPVDVHLVVAEGEDQIGRVIDRKAGDHASMKRSMADAMKRSMAKSSQVKVPYSPTYKGSLPSWM